MPLAFLFEVWIIRQGFPPRLAHLLGTIFPPMKKTSRRVDINCQYHYNHQPIQAVHLCLIRTPVPLAALSPHACLWCVYARSSPGTEMHFPHQFEEIHLWVPLSLNVIIHDDDSSALVAFRVVLVDFTLSIHHSYQRRVRPYRSFIFSRRITFTERSHSAYNLNACCTRDVISIAFITRAHLTCVGTLNVS